MRRKAFYGLLIALIVPVALFFIVDSLPKAAMPEPLFADTVVTKTVRGKQVEETIWQKLPDFKLTNQLGQPVSFSDVSLSDSGRISIVNFFFTRCPTICPGMTLAMKKLQDGIERGVRVGDNTANYVQFISITIDPERDSVQHLKRWADRFQINPVNWWLLTGDKQTIYDLSIKYMNLTIQDPQIDPEFPHTDIFVLIDKHGVIRARRDKDDNPLLYHSLDSVAMRNLAEDVVLLSLEKEEGERGVLAGKLWIMITAFVIALIAVALLLYYFRKRDGNAKTGLDKK